MKSNVYKTSFSHACPQSVYVSITRNGGSARQFQEYRAAASGGEEPISTMMRRAREKANQWIRDDQEVRHLEREFNTEGAVGAGV